MAAAAESAVQTGANGVFKICGCVYQVVAAGCGLFGGCIKKLPPAWIDVLLRLFNLANAVLLGFACFNAYGMVRAGDVTRTFLATYIGMFGILLAVVRNLFYPPPLLPSSPPPPLLFLLWPCTLRGATPSIFSAPLGISSPPPHTSSPSLHPSSKCV
jgi:hypothetical protein